MSQKCVWDLRPCELSPDRMEYICPKCQQRYRKNKQGQTYAVGFDTDENANAALAAFAQLRARGYMT